MAGTTVTDTGSSATQAGDKSGCICRHNGTGTKGMALECLRKREDKTLLLSVKVWVEEETR